MSFHVILVLEHAGKIVSIEISSDEVRSIIIPPNPIIAITSRRGSFNLSLIQYFIVAVRFTAVLIY